MTDQELLQQAKDQVAKKYEKENRTNWNDLDKDAALLAIQSAREEGYDQGARDQYEKMMKN